MSGFHRPFRPPQGEQEPFQALRPRRGQGGDEGQEEVIDPNLYGPFGHRYHDEAPDPARHVPHHLAQGSTASWHDVETTEQHQRHSQLPSPSPDLSPNPALAEGRQDHPYTNASMSQSALMGQLDSDSVLHKWGDEAGIPLRPTTSGTSHSTKPLVQNAAGMSVQYSQDSVLQHQFAEKKAHGDHTYSSHSGMHHSRAGSLFDMVHTKQGSNSNRPHIAEHGEDVPINFRHLFKRPVIRQWLYGNKLYREKDERKPSQFELVFDLIFVAVVNGLGHATAESNTAINVLKFVLSFWPCFSIWTDVRLFLNVSGTDDVLERILLLGWMILLCGYCANISGVELVLATPELLAALQSEEAAGVAPAQTENHSLSSEIKALFRRAGSASSSTEELKLAVPAFRDYWFAEGWDRAIHAAICFFLVAKLWRLAIYIYYGIALPKFRKALWLNALAMVVIAGIYVPIIFSDSPLLIVCLMSGGIVVEMAKNYIVAAAIKLFHGRSKRSGKHMFIPAQSHEHSIERYVLFVILIVGESIISSTFVAQPGHYGLNAEFGRAALGIAISVFVIWTYYDADGSRVYQHALKRNSFTSITFCHIHYPLTASLILMASSLSSLISNNTIHGGYSWYFGGSLSAIFVCLGCIGMMHRNLDKYGSTLVPRWARIVVRFLAAAVFAVLPIKTDWNTLSLMGAVAGSLFLLVCFETFGKIGAVGRRYDPDRAAEMYAKLQANGEKKLQLDRRASWHPFDDLTPGERGEEDVGIESEIGHLEEKDLVYGQRWAYAA